MRQSNLKRARGVDVSNYAKKTYLASFKVDVGKLGKLDIDKLETVPVDLSELSEIVKKEVAKKNKHNHLADSNGIRTHNHLVRKRTFNHLTKFG